MTFIWLNFVRHFILSHYFFIFSNFVLMSFHDISSRELYDSIFEKNCEQFLSLDTGAKRRWKLWLFRVNWLTLENSSLHEVFFNVKCVNIYDTLLGSKLLASLTHCDLVFGTQNEFYHFPRVRRGGEQLPSFLLLHIL